MTRSCWLLSALVLSSSAFAGDDLDDILGRDDEEEDGPAPAPTGPADDLGPRDADDVGDGRDANDGTDLLGNDSESAAVPGADTADAYRQATAQAKGMFAEEEAAFWEQYLATYPNTQFRERVQKRIDELMAEMYNRQIGDGGTVDAMDEEIRFAQSVLLDNIDPRTRLQAGVEWGNPDWINLQLDYEHALQRTFSVHGGIEHQYAGWSLGGGVRWAAIKSTRTQTLLTVMGDVYLVTEPAFPAFRPQVAFGQRIGDRVDVQAQVGPALEFRSGVQLVVQGGANVSVQATDTVSVFLETGFAAKNFSWEGDPFRFQTLTLGLKFFPLPAEKRRNLDVGLAGSAPYAQQYWQHHFGAILAQANYYLD